MAIGQHRDYLVKLPSGRIYCATAVSFDRESLLHHRQLQPFLLFMLQTLHKARHQLPLLPLVYMPQHSLHHAAVIAIGSRTSRLMWNPHADNLLPDLWLLLLVYAFYCCCVFVLFVFDQIKMSFISEGGWCIHNVLPVVRIAISTRVCTHTSTHMHHGFLPVPCSGQEVFSLCLLKDKSQTLPRVFAFVDTTPSGPATEHLT